MARTKVSRNSNGASNEQQQQQMQNQKVQKSVELNRQTSMEDHDSSEEKFQNLKSLNAILLKQTMEKRQQIESLFQAKDSLETELARSGTEKTRLEDELRGSSDENFKLKIEMGLFMAFVESRVKEMGVGVDGLVKEKSERESEIRVLKREGDDLMRKVESEREELVRVCNERDSIKSGFCLQIEETNRLKETLVGMEIKEASLVEEVCKLKCENGKIVKEKRKSGEVIERVNKERINLEKSLEEKIREIDELVKGKKEMEMVKRDQKGEIMELEKKLGNLGETVKSLTKEEEGLRGKVIWLEKNLDEAMEEANQREEHIKGLVKENSVKEYENEGLRDQNIGLEKILGEVMEKFKAKSDEVNSLVKEKSIKQSEVQGLLMEKISMEKQMEMAILQSSGKEKLVDQLLREKNDLLERFVNQEAEIAELTKLAGEQKRVAAQLGKDYNDQTKTSEKLSCNVSQLKDALAMVEVERDNARKALDEEKKNRVALKEKVLELEKTIKATRNELEKIKAEKGRLIKEKKELENRSESLRKEKCTLQKDIIELKRALSDSKTELESSRTNAKHGLTMLKTVSSLVCGLENKKREQKQEKGNDSYSVELEAIKKAFKNKESMVEEMNKEVEKMKHSVMDAHKKKNLWTFVSSFTTLFMAASVAYAAMIK